MNVFMIYVHKASLVCAQNDLHMYKYVYVCVYECMYVCIYIKSPPYVPRMI